MSAKSPCFVHSHLDKGASLQDWLAKDNEVLGSEVGVAKALQPHHRPQHHVELPCPDGSSHALSENDDSDTYGGNLTKQLAETAAGVREMSKQLGKCSFILGLSIRSTIMHPQDVLG
jgi:NAD+ kinase